LDQPSINAEPEILSLNSIADTTSASRLFLCDFLASAVQNASKACPALGTVSYSDDDPSLIVYLFRLLDSAFATG
jgi:hypothetical protein